MVKQNKKDVRRPRSPFNKAVGWPEKTSVWVNRLIKQFKLISNHRDKLLKQLGYLKEMMLNQTQIKLLKIIGKGFIDAIGVVDDDGYAQQRDE